MQRLGGVLPGCFFAQSRITGANVRVASGARAASQMPDYLNTFWGESVLGMCSAGALVDTACLAI
jgi:hypothetical protein